MALRGATKKPVAQRKIAPHTEAAAPRKRMSVEDRERQILDGAVEFFSSHGLDGQMRVLAQGIGVTHALLYHYFPTKQALIDRVYQELFEGRWKPEWESLLDDPHLPIPEKLTRFYCDYAAFILSRDFVRIFVFSGLSDHYITDRFFDLLRERLFPRLVRETRKYRGLKSRAKPSSRELELLMGLHGGIFYTGIRRWIYGQEVHGAEGSEQDRIYIEDRVKAYLVSAAIVLDSEAAPPIAARPRALPAARTAKGD
jgi:AcrR family transcriptional regulator